MKFKQTSLEGAFLIDQEPRGDERGFFARYFCVKEFADNGLNTNWVQINNSLTTQKGTLRGLHYQEEPHCEIKLVRCINGSIYDVIVDVRKDSPTFGKYFGEVLSSQNRSMMYVPKGFAHGFISLEENSEVIYLVSSFYAPESERTLLFSDKNVSIDWPVAPRVISDKDKKGQALNQL